MAKELLISDLPNIKEIKDVLEKVSKNLEMIKLISEETNDMLKSIGLKGIAFSAEIECNHLFGIKTNSGNCQSNASAICTKCGYEPRI